MYASFNRHVSLDWPLESLHYHVPAKPSLSYACLTYAYQAMIQLFLCSYRKESMLKSNREPLSFCYLESSHYMFLAL
jgi:hypothetical protein